MRDGRRPADLLSAVWSHRGWSERSAACHYARLAEAARTCALAPFADELARARDDELRHAELCERTCRELGGVPSVAPPDDAPLVGNGERDMLLDIAVTCCLGETLNVVLLHDELHTHLELDAVTRELLRDEVRHARLGWDVLAAARSRGCLDWLAGPLAAALAEAFARDAGAQAALEPGRRTALRDVAVAEVIEPGLRRLGIV